MAHVKVERTLHGNVKIVLDPTSALKLARILNWSEYIGYSDCTSEYIGFSSRAAAECEICDVEELSWELHGALLSIGVDHENL